jgi:hypothetical protein
VTTLRQTFCIALLAGLAPAGAFALNAASLPALPDQFGDEVIALNPEPTVRVAILISAKRLRRIRKWETALRERFPGLMIFRVADVPRSAPTDYEDVAETFRKRLPEDLAVGIDLDGRWAAALNVDTSVPNILVFDANGELDAVHSGMFDDKLFAQAAADIDLLLKATERSAGG